MKAKKQLRHTNTPHPAAAVLKVAPVSILAMLISNFKVWVTVGLRNYIMGNMPMAAGSAFKLVAKCPLPQSTSSSDCSFSRDGALTVARFCPFMNTLPSLISMHHMTDRQVLDYIKTAIYHDVITKIYTRQI